MRKQAKKCVGLLLALSLILSCIHIVPVFAEDSTGEESSVETSNMDTTTTWDFEDAGQLEDFELAKYWPNATSTNATQENLKIEDGYFYASNENSNEGRFKKAILKETDVAVQSISVDIYPETDASDKKVLSGGIYVGYADEVTQNGTWRADDCVFVYLQDSNTGSNYLSLNIYRGTSSGATELLKENLNASSAFYADHNAQALHMEVKIAGSYLTVKVSLLSDSTKYVEKNVDVSSKNFTADILQGRVGLGAHGYGAKFDNLTLGLMDTHTWDFNKSEEINNFELAKYWPNATSTNATQENLKIEDGYFYASNENSNEGRFKKAILKETDLAVQSISVDIYPEIDASDKKVLSGGIYVGYADEVTQNGTWRADDCVFVYLQDSNTGSNYLSLNVYRGTSSGGTELLKENLNASSAFYADHNAQALHMEVEIAGPYLTVKVSLLSDSTKCAEKTIDVSSKNFTADILQGRIGLGAHGYGAKFDNFTVNGDAFVVGGISDSQIAVSKYGTFPTGADVVDGKYILGWTNGGEIATKYKTSDGEYVANVVDPEMLGLSSQTASSDTAGRYDVRFIGSLNEFFNSTTNAYENYKRAGFVFTLDSSYATADRLIVDADNCVTKTTYNLYSGLNQTVNSVTETKTPADIYGSGYAKYFFAYEITGVSIADGKSSRTIYARAYVELENGDIVYGEPSSVTVGETAPQMDIYLIAGQSNAAGRSAFTTDYLNTQNTACVTGFSNVLYSGTAYNTADEYKTVNLEPVKSGFGVSDTTMGPELGMATALSTYYNADSGKTACIVKLAACGVSLLDNVTSGKNSLRGNWVSPSYEAYLKEQGTGVQNETLTGGLYTLFMEQVQTSLQQCKAAGYEPVIKGLYWMQGENDREGYAEYPTAFGYLANDFRTDLSTLTGQDLSRMPIIIGEISETFNSATATEVAKNQTFIEMQNTLPTSVSDCYVADISGYAVNKLVDGESVVCGTDSGHYNEADCLAIGKLVGSLMMEKAGILAE